jgi:NAD(P)-dependent dehydrogenase (short-subunit alcohol dehydrogenase family)
MRNKWTFKDIPPLSGKVVIVTGGNIGLGYESVRMLAEKGGRVVLVCRNEMKGIEARNKILSKSPDLKIRVMYLDLADLESVRTFAREFKTIYNRLDVLLNNAGIMMGPYGKTKDGLERQFGVNHIGHFALTAHLMDVLASTPNSRVVTISSRAHHYGTIDFDDLNWTNRTYDSKAAYGQSKIANLYFAYELQRRFEKAGLTVKSLAAHPGRSNTNLAHNMGSKYLVFLISKILMPLMTQSAKIGALAGLRAACDEDANGGEYYGPANRDGKSGYPVLLRSDERSYDTEVAQKLWKESEALSGVKFNV